MNGTATHQWAMFVTQATQATSNTNCPKFFDPPIGYPEDIAAKREKPRPGIIIIIIIKIIIYKTMFMVLSS